MPEDERSHAAPDGCEPPDDLADQVDDALEALWEGEAAPLDARVESGETDSLGISELLGDAFPVADWPEGVLKEGDTPTFPYLLSPVIGGVGNVDDPAAESWGGRFRRPEPERYPNYWVDLYAPAEECQATISRWRVDYLSDWKRRWARYG